MSTISKAEQKRIQQATVAVDANLRRKLVEFENKYLTEAAWWAIREIELSIKRLEEVSAKPETTDSRKKEIQFSIDLYKKRLSLDAIIKMNAYNEAKKSYDAKVKKVVDLLVSEGFSSTFLKIEEIKNRGSELEFLISNNVKEVHARLIFAHGPIKAPHFRFITTVRQK